MREAGASDQEIKQAISYAMSVHDRAKEIMKSHGLKHLGITKNIDDNFGDDKTTRIKELVSIATAFAVNSTSNLQKHMTAARTVGINDNELMSVLETTFLIKGKAGSYVQKIAKLREEKGQLQQLLQELRETQTQLVQSEKMAAIGRLTAGIAHEINTPIGALKGTIDVLMRANTKIVKMLESNESIDNVINSAEYQKSLKIIEQNTQVGLTAIDRVAKFVKSLKNFTTLEEAEFDAVDIHEGIEATFTLIQHEIKEGVNVVRKYGALPKIYCSLSELNQVFITLLSNALQAIEDKGTLKIRTSANDKNVCIEISDTGKGIPPEKLKTIFDFQFDRKDSRISMGMGLVNAYNIIQRHHGEIKVESEIGKGTTFTIILPK